MKKPVAIIGGIVLTVGIAGLGYAGWRYLREDQASSEDTVYVTTVSSLIDTASGTQNRFAGVVEPQDTVEIKLDSGRKVTAVNVRVGQEVKVGDVLFEYDLSSMQDDLTEAQLEFDELVNERESIKEQIITYTKERNEADNDQKLSYTIQIETAKMSLRKNEYSQKTKSAEIEKLKNSMNQTAVTSEIDGVIKKIDTSKMDTGDDSAGSGGDMYNSSGTGSDAFITILSTGAYRVKGKVNEQNMQSIMQGAPVLIRSRVDEKQTWKGTMGNIDTENSSNNNENGGGVYYGMGGMDPQTTSSSYNFYVDLESSEGLMLGQHVYIEMDQGQEEVKEGIWLDEYFLVDLDGDPYVWGSTGDDKLAKIPVSLGEYDEALGKYEITGGLTEKDCIAFPADNLEEGMHTLINDGMQIPQNTGGDNLGPIEMDPTAGSMDNSDSMGQMDGMPADEGQSVEDPDGLNDMVPIEGPDGEVLDSAQEWTDEDMGDMEDWEAMPMEEIPSDDNLTPLEGEGVG